jgi:hypothetical protein
MMKFRIEEGKLGVLTSDDIEELNAQISKLPQMVFPTFAQTIDDKSEIRFYHPEGEEINEQLFSKGYVGQPRDAHGRFAETSAGYAHNEPVYKSHKSDDGSLVRSANSPNGTHRYHFEKTWDKTKPPLQFVMLNPSHGSHDKKDHTLGKITNMAKANGYGGVHVSNLYAFRSRNPNELNNTANRGEVDISRFISKHAKDVVVAWGSGGGIKDKAGHAHRVNEVLRQLNGAGKNVFHLNKTKEGHPVHPAYQKSTTKFKKWDWE